MSQVIRIPEDLYNRLSLYANGFETPAQVIEKLVTFYEDKNNIKKPKTIDTIRSTNLDIVYYPNNNVNSFKKNLMDTKFAFIKLYKIDGTNELKEWDAYRFNESSSVEKNLRSGYLRSWKNKGIYKAELSVNISDLN